MKSARKGCPRIASPTAKSVGPSRRLPPPRRHPAVRCLRGVPRLIPFELGDRLLFKAPVPIAFLHRLILRSERIFLLLERASIHIPRNGGAIGRLEVRVSAAIGVGLRIMILAPVGFFLGKDAGIIAWGFGGRIGGSSPGCHAGVW